MTPKMDTDAIRGEFQTASDGVLPAGSGAFASECEEGKVCFWSEINYPDEAQTVEFYLSPDEADHLAQVLAAAAARVRLLEEEGDPAVLANPI